MSSQRDPRRLSRRTFLRLSVVTGSAALMAGLLAACQQAAPSPTAAPTKSGAPQPTAVAAAKPTTAPAPAKSQFDEWIIGVAEDITTTDPLKVAGGSIKHNVFYHLYEPLVGYEGPNFDPVPRLAESWKYLDDVTLEMKLRKNVKFHNGDDFTADDVLYTHRMQVATPELAYGYVWNSVEKVEKVDSHTVRFITKAPVASLIPNLAAIFYVIPKARETIGPEAFEKRAFGTGMYKLAGDWTRDQPVRLVANEAYWGGPPSPQRLQFKYIREPSTRVAELMNGTIHITESIPAPQVEMVKRGANTDVVVLKAARTIMQNMNLTKPPFDNVKVRQAVNYAVDRDAIVKNVLQGYGQPLVGLFGPGWMGHASDLKPYTFDIAKAKQLLVEAGLPNGLEFEWQITEGVFLKDREIAEAVAAQLKQAGITAKLRVTERATIYANFDAGNYEMVSTQYQTGVDPDRYLNWNLTRSKGVTAAKEADPLRKMQSDGRLIVDPEQRVKKYQELNKAAYEMGLLLFIHMQDELFAIDKRTGWTPYPIRALATQEFYAFHPTIKR